MRDQCLARSIQVVFRRQKLFRCEFCRRKHISSFAGRLDFFCIKFFVNSFRLALLDFTVLTHRMNSMKTWTNNFYRYKRAHWYLLQSNGTYVLRYFSLIINACSYYLWTSGIFQNSESRCERKTKIFVTQFFWPSRTFQFRLWLHKLDWLFLRVSYGNNMITQN